MWFTSDERSCRGTLILHADGTDECEHGHLCGADELGCACAGEAWPLAEAA
jgi:hypothetical protein